MTTKMLQVGDIVRINEPTKQDIEDVEFEGCGYTFKDQIGKLAVVTRVECAEHTVVQLVVCDEDYEFQLSDTRQLYWSSGIWTVTSHLSLVRESVLRTYILSEQTPQPLAGKPLPLVETQMSESIDVDDIKTIEANTIVDIVSVGPNHIDIMFLTESADTEWYEVPADVFVEYCFTTF